MGERKQYTLNQKMMSLVWLNAVIFLMIAGTGITLAQRIYRKDMEAETANVFDVSFSNVENTLHFVDNIAFNLVNDKTVKEALRAVNKNSEDRYVLVDELYYRIITGSLIANDAISIIILDQDRRQYSTAGVTKNLEYNEIFLLSQLLERRSSRTEPVWFERGGGQYLVYGREMYDTPFGGHNPLGVILISVDLDKMMAQRTKGSLARGTITMSYKGNLVYSSNGVSQEEITKLSHILTKTEKGYFVVAKDSQFSEVSFVGYEDDAELSTSNNTMVIFFTAAILCILFLSFLLTVKVVRQMTLPITFLNRSMKTMEEGDFSVKVDLEHLGSGITELTELAENFNVMTGEIERLVEDNYLRTIKEKEYQIKVLQSQINPHFLYNTLDAVNWLAVDSDKPEISSMVQALATIFREATKQEQFMITLKEELALLSCYMTIQKIRMGERLQFQFFIPEECMRYKIPKLSLQPILENSVKYVAEATMKACEIKLYAKTRENCLLIYVWDNGSGISKELLEKIRNRQVSSRVGIGLANIEERVQMLGGKDSKVRIYSSVTRGTLIKLAISQPGGEVG